MWRIEKIAVGFCERICLEQGYVYCQNIDICRQYITKIPQDEILLYLYFSIPLVLSLVLFRVHVLSMVLSHYIGLLMLLIKEKVIIND